MKRMPVDCLKCVRIYFQVHTLTRISHIIYIFPNDHRMFTLKRTLEISQWCSSLAPSETMGGLVKTQLMGSPPGTLTQQTLHYKYRWCCCCCCCFSDCTVRTSEPRQAAWFTKEKLTVSMHGLMLNNLWMPEVTAQVQYLHLPKEMN